MLSKAQKRSIAAFAAREVRRNDEHHSLPHLRQTARLALRMARAEGADPDACWAAAMLHDIRKEAEGDHAAAGAEAAAAFLSKLGAPKAFIAKVGDAIHFHNKDFSGGPMERRVLWDADKLPLMSPKGFQGRMLPYWMMKKGEDGALETSICEYFLFLGRFHTGTGRRKAEKQRSGMERLFLRLRAGAPL